MQISKYTEKLIYAVYIRSEYTIRIGKIYICAYISAYPNETGWKSCGFRKYKGIYICGYPKCISTYGQFYSIPAHLNKFCETQLIIL